VYGHCHFQREAYLDGIWPERRSMDVGVDSARHHLGEFRPFSEDEVVQILGQRKGHHDLAYERGNFARFGAIE